MENKSIHCTLTDAQLIAKADQLIDELIGSGGKSWTMQVPARPNADTDLIFAEVVNRFKAIQAKIDNYGKALKRIAKQSKIDEMDANEVDGDISEGYDAIINVAREALSAGEREKEVENKEDARNKAWDDWKGSLVKHDNALVHYKERPEKYTEPFTFEEFKAVMLEKSPVFIYNTMYSNDKPLYQITSHFMPSGVTFFCTSWADKTPEKETLESFYQRLKRDGLEYAKF
jgi:hypothetical protein